jgi:hypothetical protein
MSQVTNNQYNSRNYTEIRNSAKNIRMTSSIGGRDLVSISDLSKGEIELVLKTALNVLLHGKISG